MKWLNRLRCELQDHIRVTEVATGWWSTGVQLRLEEYAAVRTVLEAIQPDQRRDCTVYGIAFTWNEIGSVTRCTRCGYEWERTR